MPKKRAEPVETAPTEPEPEPLKPAKKPRRVKIPRSLDRLDLKIVQSKAILQCLETHRATNCPVVKIPRTMEGLDVKIAETKAIIQCLETHHRTYLTLNPEPLALFPHEKDPE